MYKFVKKPTSAVKVGEKYYSPHDRLNIKYPRVTGVIGKYYYNPVIKKWKEDVGLAESTQITQSASAIGTQVHKLNELYFSRKPQQVQEYSHKKAEYEAEVTNRHNLFIPLLDRLDPLLTEQALVWEDISPMNPSETYGFGGTMDLVARLVNPGDFFSDKKCTIPYTGFSKKGEIFVLGDYKNWKSPKYASGLVNVYLQLAAYTALVNQNTQNAYQIQDALILGSSSNSLYLYHLGRRELNWYWSWFKQILHNYYNFTDSNTITFDWRTFENYSLGKKRTFDPEQQEYKTELLEEKYLAQRIYIKESASPDEATNQEDNS